MLSVVRGLSRTPTARAPDLPLATAYQRRVDGPELAEAKSNPSAIPVWKATTGLATILFEVGIFIELDCRRGQKKPFLECVFSLPRRDPSLGEIENCFRTNGLQLRGDAAVSQDWSIDYNNF